MTLFDPPYSLTRVDRYLRTLQMLLPPGKAWTTRANAELTKWLRGLSYEWYRVELRANDVLQEMFPDTASETLSDWERIAGLPDCGPIANDPATRRVDIVEKLTSNVAPTPQRFVDIAANYGEDIVVTEGISLGATCISTCTEALGQPDALYQWQIVGPDDPILECLLRREVPPHTELIYTPGSYPDGFTYLYEAENANGVANTWDPTTGAGPGTLTLAGGGTLINADLRFNLRSVVSLDSSSATAELAMSAFMPTQNSLPLTLQTWTIGCCFAHDATSPDQQRLFSIRDAAAGTSAGEVVAVHVHNLLVAPQTTRLRAGTFGSYYTDTTAGVSGVNDTDPHTIVLAFDGPAAEMRLYLDGVLVDNPTGLVLPGTSFAGQFIRFGVDDAATADAAQSLCDWAAMVVYESALPEADCVQIHNTYALEYGLSTVL